MLKLKRLSGSRHFQLVGLGITVAFLSLIGVLYILLSHASNGLEITQIRGKTTVEGELDIRHGDNFHNSTDVDTFTLTTASNQRIGVDFTGSPPENLSGRPRVRITGTAKNKRLQVAPSDLEVLQDTFGQPKVHKTAVILLNFSNQTQLPLTSEEVKQAVFGTSNSISAFFSEESGGIISLAGASDVSGDVFGYYTLPSPGDCSNYMGLGITAEQIASQQTGIDFENAYDNIMYLEVFDSTYESCNGIGGWGEVGNKHSWVFLDAVTDPAEKTTLLGVGAHEMTHNLGTWHANAYYCKDAKGNFVNILPDETKCSHAEYGDGYDVMGGATYTPMHSNNAFLDMLNILPPSSIQTVSASGDYVLNPVENPNSKVRAIKILRAIDKFNHYQYYYLEYRQPSGFDNYNADTNGVTGTLVRLQDRLGTIMTHILVGNLKMYNVPVAPKTTASQATVLGGAGNEIVTPAAMADGGIFNDPTHYVKITQLSHATDGVHIHVDVSHLPMPDTTPPPKPTGLKINEKATRLVTLSWRILGGKDVMDDRVYRDGVFVGYAYPDLRLGRVRFFDTGSFTPGQKIHYQVAAEDFASNISPTATINATIPQPGHLPPTTPTLKTATVSSAGVYLIWTASKDKSGVMGYVIHRMNTATNETVDIDTFPGKTTQFADYPEGGTYIYTVSAYDTDGNRSAASNSITVTVTDTGPKG